ncbi:MAG: ABC transporter permease [Solirubrobacterales bacterium]|nr:ABC transporter permease [Solirubrobacterales bacterium]
MTSLLALTPTELRLLTRDWTVLVFAFVFPPLVMLILAGVFGTHATVGFFWQNPQNYYVAASAGVPIIALALVGLPVTLASYRERGVLRRLEAFGVTPAQTIAAQAIVTAGLVLIGVVAVLAAAIPTYGIPHVVHPAQVLLGLGAGTLTLILIGVAIGLAAPSARAAQAIGLIAFFPLYLLGGGGPPKGAMTGVMRTISGALPSPIPGIVDPWLGLPGLPGQLAVFGAWSAAAIGAICWLVRRTPA